MRGSNITALTSDFMLPAYEEIYSSTTKWETVNLPAKTELLLLHRENFSSSNYALFRISAINLKAHFSVSNYFDRWYKTLISIQVN